MTGAPGLFLAAMVGDPALTSRALAIRLRPLPARTRVPMAKRRSPAEEFLKELEEMVEEAIAELPNPDLPKEEDRMKKALMARIVRMGSGEFRAGMRDLVDQIWNDLTKKRQGGRISSGGPRSKKKKAKPEPRSRKKSKKSGRALEGRHRRPARTRLR